MTLGRLRDELAEDDEQARSLLQEAMDLAEEAVREVRVVSYLMHPPMLDEGGLSPALRWYAKGFTVRSGIDVTVDVPEDLPRYSQDVETTIFRIVQEALTNVHRYSGSRTAKISVVNEEERIHVEIRDFGSGLTPPSPIPSQGTSLGVGIAGMRERVNLLLGYFEIESAPGQGTTVRVTLPVASVNGSR